MKVGTKMELQRELSYGQPDGSPRRAILALFFSVYAIEYALVPDRPFTERQVSSVSSVTSWLLLNY